MNKIMACIGVSTQSLFPLVEPDFVVVFFTNLMIKVSAPDEQLASLCVKKILMIQVLGILKINAVQLAFQ